MRRWVSTGCKSLEHESAGELMPLEDRLRETSPYNYVNRCAHLFFFVEEDRDVFFVSFLYFFDNFLYKNLHCCTVHHLTLH